MWVCVGLHCPCNTALFCFTHLFPVMSVQVVWYWETADIMVNIPEYYAGKNVLISGATGFMGKVQLWFSSSSSQQDWAQQYELWWSLKWRSGEFPVWSMLHTLDLSCMLKWSGTHDDSPSAGTSLHNCSHPVNCSVAVLWWCKHIEFYCQLLFCNIELSSDHSF